MEFAGWGVLFFIAGFILESCVSFYHRSRESNKFLQAGFFSGTITLIGILVISKIVDSVTNSTLGIYSLIFALIFALGKGIGTVISLKLWDKYFSVKRCTHCTCNTGPPK